MKINFEGSHAVTQWAKATVTDLTTDEVIGNIFWVDLQWGIVCYARSNDDGSIKAKPQDASSVISRTAGYYRIVRHGRFKVELTSKPAHPNIKGKEFELIEVECTVEKDRPQQRVVHPEPLPPNTQKVIHKVDLEDGESSSERISSEA